MLLSPHQDLRFEPFSRRGSYLNFRRFDDTTYPDEGRQGLFLRHCHGARFLSPWLARITVNGVEPLSQWDEAVLTLSPPNGGGHVEIAFDGTESLRLRGQGCALELEFETAPGASMYPTRCGAWEVNTRACRRKVLLRAMVGELKTETDWHGEASKRMVARFTTDQGDAWEGVLDYFDSTWIPRDPRSFDVCAAEVRADFASFVEALPMASDEFAASKRRAAYVNWSAIVEPCGQFRRPAMLMSKNYMSNVWSWDHAFNAMAHMAGDPALAWDQMLLMADRQNEHGAFPDAQNDVHEHFNFCKPPIHGWAVGLLRASNPGFFTPSRVRETIAWLEPWTRWWMNHRLWEDGGLPLYLHGNDSGWDNSTFFLRGVPVFTPDLPAFLALQCRELAHLHHLLGHRADEIRWATEADRLQNLLLKTLWDGERFFALRLPGKEQVSADTLIEAIPLVLGSALPLEVRDRVILRLKRYLTPFGLATEHPQSPHYTPDGYWRGPIWAPPTLLIIDGLQRSGEGTLAKEIALRYLRLCTRSGFAENFDALTGAPLRDKAYTWTSSVFLILLSRLSEATPTLRD
ncbi:MAG: hypothetical protein JJT96_10790 [Opitutales bacterium]|nr:hypothetical protein [Opitutales bacterium]